VKSACIDHTGGGGPTGVVEVGSAAGVGGPEAILRRKGWEVGELKRIRGVEGRMINTIIGLGQSEGLGWKKHGRWTCHSYDTACERMVSSSRGLQERA
jgi:hypothetical protein